MVNFEQEAGLFSIAAVCECYRERDDDDDTLLLKDKDSRTEQLVYKFFSDDIYVTDSK